jgi:AcrR family transcriptional regulator
VSHPTATHILATAPRVFADRGFAGASTRTLADACGVNIGTLAYHFGNKEGLYHAVIDQVYTHILACLSVKPEGNSSAELVRSVTAAVYRKGLEHRDGIRLLLRHVMAEGSVPAHVQAKWSPHVMTAVAALLSELNLPEGPDHRLALLSINHLIARYVVSDPRDIQPFAEGDPIDAVADHIGEVAVKLLGLD